MKQLIYSTVLFFTIQALLPCRAESVLPYLNFRSASVNAARELVGWQTMIHKADMNTCYGLFSITPEYIRSFKAHDITRSLFGNSVYERICEKSNLAFKVQGSKVLNRDNKAWLADYFYLPTDFSSIISINPQIDTFLIDFNFFVGFDTWAPGLFLRAHAPMTNTRWDLRFCESNLTKGINGYDPGYFNDTYSTSETTIVGIPNSKLLNSFEDFIFAQQSITDSTICYEPLYNARMSRYRLTKSRLAEIQVAFGYDFLLAPSYHTGLEVRCSIPIGNEPIAEFLFEPIVGNGHHGELGIGLTSHCCFWSDSTKERALNAYLDANISHLFNAHQRRTFDLKGMPLSRYMLAMDMRAPVTNLIATTDSESVVPQSQFKYRFTPVANITTIPVHSKIDIQADIALKFAYTQENIQWDIGYNFWAISCEKLCRQSSCCCSHGFDNGWALKGDSFVFGFSENATGTISALGVPLAVSQSNATIFKGTNNWPDGIGSAAWNQNPGIDTPKGLAYDSDEQNLVTHQIPYSATWDNVYTSSAPRIISAQDLDMCSAQAKGLSHKVFTHLNYTFNACSTWIPYLGIGGEVEFGKNSHDACRYCSVSQWGIWLKGGLSFAGR